MSANKCPLCGKETVEDESFCRDCQEIADNPLSDQLLASDTAERESTSDSDVLIEETAIEEEVPSQAEDEAEVWMAEDTSPTKNKSPLIKNVIIILLFFLIALAAGGGYSYWKKIKSDEYEAALWDKCIETNTPPAYSDYLRQFPNGKFHQQAHQKIVVLREEETKRWKELRQTGDLNAYAAFLVDHPDSPHAQAVKMGLDSLSWSKAQTENTVAAYETYISNANLGLYPGEYRDLAQDKFEYLSQLKTLSETEAKEIYKILDNFLAQLSSGRFDKLEPMMSPTLNNFFGVKGQSRDVIAKSIEADIKTRNIKSITYIIVEKQLNEVIQDNKGVYFFDVHLSRAISYKDRKRKKEQVILPVNVEMDKDKLIRFIADESKE